MPKHRIIDNNNGTVTIGGNCVFTGEPYSVTVNKEDYKKFEAGELIQRAFPKVPREEREFIRSGISPKGWTEKFGGLDE